MSTPATQPRELWWREWPLGLAVVTLTLAMLGKGAIASALEQPVLLGCVHLLLFGAYLMLMFD